MKKEFCRRMKVCCGYIFFVTDIFFEKPELFPADPVQGLLYPYPEEKFSP